MFYSLTKSDLKLFVIPVLLFAIFAALSGSLLTTSQSADIDTILTKLPLAFVFILLNLFVFCLGNQPDAIVEDTINKPYRPIPSGLITADGARRLILVLSPFVLAISWYLGAGQETLYLYFLNFAYNDLKGADEHFVIRNLIIALAMGIYNLGALRIVCSGCEPNTMGFIWLALFSAAIFATIHVQDIRDQVGDAIKGRSTMPIVFGDMAARWSVAIPVVIISAAMPAILRVPIYAYVLPAVLGGVAAGRCLLIRGSAEADGKTNLCWALWLAFGISTLPVIASPPAWLVWF